MRAILRVLLFAGLLILWDWVPGLPHPGHALDPTTPPSVWHPYQGGVNCIQVVDADANFNCFPGATINPVTGVVTGLSTAPGGGTFLKSVAIVPSTTATTPQLLGSGDLVISTSPPTIATAGPRINGVTIRVRQVGAGRCQLVVAGGDGFKEFVIPVLDPSTLAIAAQPLASFSQSGFTASSFPGGNFGC